MATRYAVGLASTEVRSLSPCRLPFFYLGSACPASAYYRDGCGCVVCCGFFACYDYAFCGSCYADLCSESDGPYSCCVVDSCSVDPYFCSADGCHCVFSGSCYACDCYCVFYFCFFCAPCPFLWLFLYSHLDFCYDLAPSFHQLLCFPRSLLCVSLSCPSSCLSFPSSPSHYSRCHSLSLLPSEILPQASECHYLHQTLLLRLSRLFQHLV
mmetsp:Transcript_25654/g.40105  ORF Transcript_25654/g.40105 Transcript_25654/m.40105 type:complete len:211 (-) Transcript_25654:805-1437(-)